MRLSLDPSWLLEWKVWVDFPCICWNIVIALFTQVIKLHLCVHVPLHFANFTCGLGFVAASLKFFESELGKCANSQDEPDTLPWESYAPMTGHVLAPTGPLHQQEGAKCMIEERSLSRCDSHNSSTSAWTPRWSPRDEIKSMVNPSA